MAVLTNDMHAMADRAIAEARFKPGDVVVTVDKVPAVNSQGKKEGYADPGWEWRVVELIVTWRGRTCTIAYRVTAHSAPEMYFQVLRDSQIKHKVGVHEGDLYAKKAAEVAG